jgi:hypothetical protein
MGCDGQWITSPHELLLVVCVPPPSYESDLKQLLLETEHKQCVGNSSNHDTGRDPLLSHIATHQVPLALFLYFRIDLHL